MEISFSTRCSWRFSSGGLRAQRRLRRLISSSAGLFLSYISQGKTIAFCDLEKQALILAAEGKKEAAFRDAEARERIAQAEAAATSIVSDAIKKGNINAINYFLGQKYIEALKGIAVSPNQKLIMMPLETQNVMNSIAGIAEIAKDVLHTNTTKKG